MTHRTTVLAFLGLCTILISSTAWSGRIVYPWNATTAIVKAGENFTVFYHADKGESVESVELRGPYNSVILPSVDAKTGHWIYDEASRKTYNTRLSVRVPSTTPEERYDLVLHTSVGEALSRSAVKVIRTYRRDYTVFHISDTHICEESNRAPDGISAKMRRLSAPTAQR